MVIFNVSSSSFNWKATVLKSSSDKGLVQYFTNLTPICQFTQDQNLSNCLGDVPRLTPEMSDDRNDQDGNSACFLNILVPDS